MDINQLAYRYYCKWFITSTLVAPFFVPSSKQSQQIAQAKQKEEYWKQGKETVKYVCYDNFHDAHKQIQLNRVSPL